MDTLNFAIFCSFFSLPFHSFLHFSAEPEILVREIKSNDKYVIIASDGVFEFMTNQMVADIVNQKIDPLVACRAIIAAAYDLW